MTRVDGARRPVRRLRVWVLGAISVLGMSVVALALLVVAAATLGRAREFHRRAATGLARLLLALWGIRLRVHGGPWPDGQTVYISNHPSTLDPFVLVALGLPRTRFFLSGFLRQYVPLGIIAWLMGTFFTVPQSRPAERARIFAAAARTLRRTGESVYASPEGQRRPDGLGPFNKGAFHLAASIGAPITPLCLRIPASVTPGLGYDTRPGPVEVHVGPAIDTRGWREQDAARHRDEVRAWFVDWERSLGEAHRADVTTETLVTHPAAG